MLVLRMMKGRTASGDARGTMAAEPIIEVLWSCKTLARHPERKSVARLALNRLAAALRRAVKPDGRLVPPLAQVDGQLLLLFDEGETLRALVGLLRPDGARDEQLQAELSVAQDVLNEPPVPATLAQTLTADLLRRFAERERLLPADSLRHHLERMLVEQRHFRRSWLLGGEHVHARMIPYGAVAGDKELIPVPLYLPLAAVDALPAMLRLDVRLTVSVHGRLDQDASYPQALLCLSLARKIKLSEFISPLPHGAS